MSLQCDACGLTFEEFRRQGVLGCPHDYVAFEDALLTLIEHAQHGATEHVGKVPRHSGRNQKKQNAVLKLRAQLRGAIAAENYELAAQLRDRIKELEGS
ncbi:MAG: UvrB/UvrC motif-containing protein [Planctomycetes bacterium]|nr:UvrB/UvrC motif-containing protein [Planctomycetota bacterium]